MQFLFKSNAKDEPLEGFDWIVVSANALGLAIVTAATIHANSPASMLAEAPAPIAIEVASLD